MLDCQGSHKEVSANSSLMMKKSAHGLSNSTQGTNI